MKPVMKTAAVAVGFAVSLVLAQSCSDPTSDDSSGDKATIDEISVATGIAEMSTLVPICRPSSGQSAEVSSSLDEGMPTLLARVLEVRRTTAILGTLRAMSFSSNQPVDKLGDCGGRATYLSYNHSSGTTTATYAYQDYCNQDSETGNRTTLNGNIAFKEIGTPGDYGPIISKIEAGSPAGVAETTRTAGGQVLSSRLIKFEEYEHTLGVPGGDPTSSQPDKTKVKEFAFTNQSSGKTYRQTEFSMTNFITSSGGEQMTVSSRGYRSNGDFFNISTTTPITSDSDGDFTGGKITFSGANNSTAVFSVVPGSTPQGTLTLNGQPVTNVPVCR